MNVKMFLSFYMMNCSLVYSNEVSNYIALTQNNTEIILDIQIDSQENYEQIEIYRSNDTQIGFDKIGMIYYIDTNKKIIQFTDKTPIPNSINFYKISYLNNTISPIHSIYYAAYNQAGFSLFNEENSSTIFLNNISNTNSLSFYLFDMSGRTIKELSEINDSKVYIETNDLHHGFYFFQLYQSKNNKILQGKIFIP